MISQNPIFFEKQEILKSLRKVDIKDKNAFEFVKKLSTFMDLEEFEQCEIRLEMRERFYTYLVKVDEDCRYEQLMLAYDDGATNSNQTSKNNTE